jgi:DNA-binding response OmpR family regulator
MIASESNEPHEVIPTPCRLSKQLVENMERNMPQEWFSSSGGSGRVEQLVDDLRAWGEESGSPHVETTWSDPSAAVTHDSAGLHVDISRNVAAWNGQDLGLTAAVDIRVLDQLAQAKGAVVRYDVFYPGDQKARPALRTSIDRLRRALRKAGCTCRIEACRGHGYRLTVT